ncbi:MAG: D-alanyl-D-alanine dipeptidase [Crocinitomicaceae bacterium]|nr:D-alanyl-D-alanine dipeptidase [Crocinitomicaceae bacterium]|tara:strand:+ start:5470 stop:6171 length:702 start_codon:yes stop_codon:yes gene_type:complete
MEFKLKLVLIGITLLCFACVPAEKKPKYGLSPTNDLETYNSKVAENRENELIDLEQFIPGIKLDIRYATDNNFVEEPVYQLARAYARKPVAEALSNAQEEFESMGLSIKVFDAYRPYSITVKFYKLYKDTTYVASPYSGSRHNRGAAIDLTLFDLNSGKDLNMGTEYDDFTELAHPANMNLDSMVLKNRELLISTMNKHGFAVYPSEWWHFDYKGWEKFELLDLSFEKLETNQ